MVKMITQRFDDLKEMGVDIVKNSIMGVQLTETEFNIMLRLLRGEVTRVELDRGTEYPIARGFDVHVKRIRDGFEKIYPNRKDAIITNHCEGYELGNRLREDLTKKVIEFLSKENEKEVDNEIHAERDAVNDRGDQPVKHELVAY